MTTDDRPTTDDPPRVADRGSPSPDPPDDERPDSELIDQPAAGGIGTTTNLGQMANIVHGGMHLHIARAVTEMRRARDLDDAYVRSIMSQFVGRSYCVAGGDNRAMSSAEAARLFYAYSCVVLVGAPGTGRRTAAIALLYELGLPLQEVTLATLDANIADVANRARTAYLVRAAPDPAAGYLEIARQLSVHQHAIRAAGSCIVAVVDSGAWTHAHDFRSDQVLVVQPPEPRQLLVTELQSRGLDDVQGVADAVAAQDAMRSLKTREVVSLAARLVEAKSMLSARGHPTVDDIVRAAVGAFRHWDRDLDHWFKNHRDVRSRLFLIATAMLEGASADSILRAMAGLAERTGADELPDDGIADSGLRELAAEADAELTRERRLIFRRPAFAEAVLNYVYRDRSNTFQRHLWEWAAALPFEPRTQTRSVAEGIAGRMLAIASHARDTRFLRMVISEWYAEPTQDIVVDLLTAAAIDENVGAPTRGRLLDWADDHNDPRVLHAVADVCCSDFALAYPGVTLTRLSHLAGRDIPDLPSKVANGLLGLWQQPPSRGAILRRLVSWVREGSEPRYSIGCDVLASLVRADRDGSGLLHFAMDAPWIRSELTDVLAIVFDTHENAPDVRRACFIWLDLSLELPSVADYVIDLLASVANVDGATSRRIAVLRDLPYGWQLAAGSHVGPDHRELRERLIRRLHNADPVLRPTTPERGEGYDL